jgi:bifunctional protein TilS/HprT
MEEKELAYYKSIRDAVSLLNSQAVSGEVLKELVHGIAKTTAAAVSLVLLDSTGKNLVHTASWGLKVSYLHKGMLNADKSLGEAMSGQVVVIDDVLTDKRVQYPDLAARAGISSILAVPLFIGGDAVGGLRIYMKKPCKFSSGDINYATTMAKLIAIAINNQNLFNIKKVERKEIIEDEGPQPTLLQRVQQVVFAHPSEKEFARLLDFYKIEWVYEPRSFPLKWEDGQVTEMFTPDFYLPDIDLYIELTTLKQSLVTKKNRKLRRLRELNPEIKITLLYKKDFDRLLAKYGFGALAESKSRSIKRVLFTSPEIQHRIKDLAEQISIDYADCRPVMIGVLRGVFCFMADLVREMTIPLDIDFMAISYYHDVDGSAVKITKDIDINIKDRHVIMVEDIVDTGMTLSYIIKYLKMKGPASVKVCALLDKRIRRIVDVGLEYIGFEVPDELLIGYGLDYQEEYRNLPFIGILESEAETYRGKEALHKD